ncbi:MAG: hypothetical protein WCL34_07100, partial [Methylococcaceae bacterium]
MAERRRRIQKPPNDPLAWVDKEISSTTDIKTDASQEETPVIEASKTNFLNGEDEMTEEKMISGSLLGDVKIEHLLEGVSTCLQLADENYNIIYMNPSLMSMFSNAESDIRKDLPQFNKNTLMGTNMDIFYRNPSHQRKMMDGLRGKTSTEINLGGRTFSLSATPLFDTNGKRTNTIVEWNDVTAFKQVTDVLFSVANGDLTHDLTFCSEEGTVKKLHESVCLLKENIARMVGDANILSVAAFEGRLATRADATKHQGDFRKIVEGVNGTLDAVIGPLNVAADYVDKISQGNTPAKITDTYNGDFNVLKNNLNTCIDAINQQAAAAKGIAAGDFSVKVDVRSENDELSKSLIQVINVLKSLQDEMQRLTVASNEGLLSERGKPEKFQGEYAAVVNGVNNMLDAILLPIGEGNRILSLICGGDLRQKVEVACQGDHDKMKQAVNGVHGWLSDLVAYVTKIANGDMTAEMAKASNDDQIHEYLILMRESIKSLVSDATLLSVAAVEGKLATRADATKHQGDFR